MRTIKVNGVSQTGYIDFSPQLISFILGICYLLDIHLGARTGLCILCDPFYCSFFNAVAQDTYTSTFGSFPYKNTQFFWWRSLLSIFIYKHVSWCISTVWTFMLLSTQLCMEMAYISKSSALLWRNPDRHSSPFLLPALQDFLFCRDITLLMDTTSTEVTDEHVWSIITKKHWVIFTHSSLLLGQVLSASLHLLSTTSVALSPTLCFSWAVLQAFATAIVRQCYHSPQPLRWQSHRISGRQKMIYFPFFCHPLCHMASK